MKPEHVSHANLKVLEQQDEVETIYDMTVVANERIKEVPPSLSILTTA